MTAKSDKLARQAAATETALARAERAFADFSDAIERALGQAEIAERRINTARARFLEVYAQCGNVTARPTPRPMPTGRNTTPGRSAPSRTFPTQ
jgi:hypothetical protein